MKPIKLLSIGNSFSYDAHFFLKDICRQNDFDIELYNLYIGGCPLQRHWDNVENNTSSYELYINGQKNIDISIHEGIKMHEFDVITLQQASIDSGILETYYPYLLNLIDWIKIYQPKAKILFHQTWAYESDYTEERFKIYNSSTQNMFNAITEAYNQAAKNTGFNIINSGKSIQKLRDYPQFFPNGSVKLTAEDSVHLSGYGKYAAALTWYKFLSCTTMLKKIYYPQDLDKNLIDVINSSVFD